MNIRKPFSLKINAVASFAKYSLPNSWIGDFFIQRMFQNSLRKDVFGIGLSLAQISFTTLILKTDFLERVPCASSLILPNCLMESKLISQAYFHSLVCTH